MNGINKHIGEREKMANFKLIRSLNESINEEKYHTETLKNNVEMIVEELIISADKLLESATKVLYNTEAQIRGGKDVDKQQLRKALVLMILMDEDVREAFNLNDKKIDIINKRVSEDERVDSFLIRISEHPSISRIIGNLESSVEENSEQFANKLAKARLFYERV